MKLDQSVVCVIPARAGSKRIPDKNLQHVGGISLLERAVRVCLEALGSVIVSTDDESYAAHARVAGAVVPGLRPAALASDETMTEEVVRHVLLEWCEPDIDSVVVVQPTSPFTSADDVTSTLRALRVNSGAATALTALRLPPTTAYALVEDETGLARFLQPHLLRIRTQDLPPLHAPTGGVYAAPAARLRSGGALVAEPVAIVEVPIERALDVDGPADLNRARRQATLKRDGIS